MPPAGWSNPEAAADLSDDEGDDDEHDAERFCHLWADLPDEPTAQNKYATAQAMNGVFGYVIYAAGEGFSLTFANAQKYYYIMPGAGLTAGAFTMMPNPGDGQMACIRSTQSVGTLTMHANTGQAISATPTVSAMSANTIYCWLYSASAATWYPI